jgi:hypothetical protein
VDVAVLYNHAAEINADAEHDPLALGRLAVALLHPPLHCHRTGDRLHDTRKLDEDTVARRLDDAPLVLGNLRVDQLAAMGAQPR